MYLDSSRTLELRQPRTSGINTPRKKKPRYSERHGRLQPIERRFLVKFAFDILDPLCTGTIDGKKLKDISDELGYLIRQCRTHDARERQLFISKMGADTLRSIEDDEKKAYEHSVDLDDEITENEETDAADENEDLGNISDQDFIAPEDDDSDPGVKQIDYIPTHSSHRKCSRRRHAAKDPVLDGEEEEGGEEEEQGVDEGNDLSSISNNSEEEHEGDSENGEEGDELNTEQEDVQQDDEQEVFVQAQKPRNKHIPSTKTPRSSTKISQLEIKSSKRNRGASSQSPEPNSSKKKRSVFIDEPQRKPVPLPALSFLQKQFPIAPKRGVPIAHAKSESKPQAKKTRRRRVVLEVDEEDILNENEDGSSITVVAENSEKSENEIMDKGQQQDVE